MVTAANGGAEKAHRLAEDLVTGLMAVEIVVRLEVVDVEDHQGHDSPFSSCRIERFKQDSFESSPVAGIGEFVGLAELFKTSDYIICNLQKLIDK